MRFCIVTVAAYESRRTEECVLSGEGREGVIETADGIDGIVGYGLRSASEVDSDPGIDFVTRAAHSSPVLA
jgi:hypothetical protein